MAEPVNATEVQIMSFSSGPVVAESLIKRIASAVGSSSKPSLSRITKGIKTRILGAETTLQRQTQRYPLKLKLDITGQHNLSPKDLEMKPLIDFSASRRISHSTSDTVELKLKYVEGGEGKMLVIYRLPL
ncbi:MAG: hypothetical protein J5J00_15880 [Deltaproteobacteria bacterium]|nr:hypothetical protein [Deltaproteobacteria bacterium]